MTGSSTCGCSQLEKWQQLNAYCYIELSAASIIVLSELVEFYGLNHVLLPFPERDMRAVLAVLLLAGLAVGRARVSAVSDGYVRSGRKSEQRGDSIACLQPYQNAQRARARARARTRHDSSCQSCLWLRIHCEITNTT